MRSTVTEALGPGPQLVRVLADRMGCLKGGVVANVVIPTAEYVRLASHYGFGPDFCHANDPHEEHDFGSFEAEGHTIFFKIDYYDRDLAYHSPDASDPAVTERVMTVMLAEEY